MTYLDRIRELTEKVSTTLIDFSKERGKTRIPTQASCNFITNKEQGDWAENLVFRAVNENSKNFVAVRYGKSDALIAGQEGFNQFYQEFQNELDTIGKRPDILIFKKADYEDKLGTDISKLPQTEITAYVKKAIAGIEVRLSAFLIDKYELEIQKRTQKHTQMALETRDKVSFEYADILEHKNRIKYIPIIEHVGRNVKYNRLQSGWLEFK